MIKIYVALWAMLALAAGFLGVTGNLTNLAATVIGFISMPLIFMGMIIILPGKLMHAPAKEETSKNPTLKTKLTQLKERTGDALTVKIAHTRLNEKY